MATIRQNRAGNWEAMIRRRGWKSVTRTFDTEREAKRWARNFEADVAAGRFVPNDQEHTTTLREALDLYRSQRTVHKRGSRQETYRIERWKKHLLADVSLARIESSDIAQYIAEREHVVGSQAIHHELKIISDLFETARTEWGMKSLKNPVADVRKPTLPRHRDRRLEHGEEERLLEECGSELKAAVLLALETAMRRGDLCALRWDKIDLDKRIARLAQTKNGHAHTVPLSSKALAVLRGLPRRLDGRVFGWDDPHSITRAFERACRRGKVHGLTFHDLRHEALSRLAERGLDIPHLSAVSGHRSWSALRRYVNLRAEEVARRLG